MWLIMVHQLDPLYKSYGSKNSPGVIWVYWGQKVIFTKNAISPTDDMPWSYDSCILISYIPSTKVIFLAIQSGSFGVTGVKRSFLPKMLFLPQITCHGHVTNVSWSAIYPLQKVWVYKFTQGHLTLKWSRGVPMDPKISFRALARKRKVIGRSPSLTLSNFQVWRPVRTFIAG